MLQEGPGFDVETFALTSSEAERVWNPRAHSSQQVFTMSRLEAGCLPPSKGDGGGLDEAHPILGSDKQMAPQRPREERIGMGLPWWPSA